MVTDKDVEITWSPNSRVMAAPPSYRVTGYLSKAFPTITVEPEPIYIVDLNAYFDEDKAREVGLIQ